MATKKKRKAKKIVTTTVRAFNKAVTIVIGAGIGITVVLLVKAVFQKL